MKSREIFDLKMRGILQNQIGTNTSSLMGKIYLALLTCESEIEEKDIEIRELKHSKEALRFHYLHFEKESESKDKEIAELKEDKEKYNKVWNEDIHTICTQQSEIQSLKEEVERLKEFEFMYNGLNK